MFTSVAEGVWARAGKPAKIIPVNAVDARQSLRCLVVNFIIVSSPVQGCRLALVTRREIAPSKRAFAIAS
ncbi:hypothetical protein [Acidocella sp.]|uniref:hypothetical protein n=1 Tax=Acidocella sp. TaxID=50710 RepID=UPI0026079228|nr:hypothetical protein [Acidocella sp.]